VPVLEEAWALLRTESNTGGHPVGDRVLAELAELYAGVGNAKDLKALLDGISNRLIRGSSADRVANARQSLWLMEHEPETSLRCGPASLSFILTSQGRNPLDPKLQKANATCQGTSLYQNFRWSEELGLGLQMAKRGPASPLPVPSMLHWKSGHFVAVVEEHSGRYLVKDPTISHDLWVSRAALEDEASGYALAPKGRLPGGWAPVAAQEGRRVWGSGTTSSGPNNGPFPDDKKKPESCPLNGMAGYFIYSAYVALGLSDVPVGYTPPRGYPIQFRLSYSQANLYQPATFTYSNLGPKWTTDWIAYIQDDPMNPGQNTNLRTGDGGLVPYSGYNSTTKTFATQYRTHDQLTISGASTYVRTFPDGSKEVYAQANGATVFPRKIFLTQRVDPAGNAVIFGYDGQLRLTTVTDALGQVTSLSYELPTDPLKITKVTDPFGRNAVLSYNALGQLASITDAVGLISSFSYGPTPQMPSAAPDFVNALTTPYGTTTFVFGQSGTQTWIVVTDPSGQQERVEFMHSAPGIAASDPNPPAGFTNSYLDRRNTFFWDKRAMALYPGDYTKASITHFLHTAQSISIMSSIVESTKNPLERRVWMSYGRTDNTIQEGPSALPLTSVRVLDDGTTQQSTYQYNDWGKVTRSTDAAGRATTYVYSTDGLDLLEVRNTTGALNDLLAKYTYNAQHKPLTATDAAGQMTSFAYNSFGQIATITNPKTETTTLTYDANGYLTQVDGPVAGSTTGFTYDQVGRISTVTGPDQATLGYGYDNLDRRTTVTYPDGTTEASLYDRLDVARTKDRKDQWTLMAYNPNRQLVEVQDPQGRVTRLDWCGCGTLEGLTDPMGRITNWARDVQGRVTTKIYPDLSQTRYTYDQSGRLATRLDAKNQTTNYAYFVDNNLKQVSYTNALKPTPSVGYTYDGAYNRLTQMVDGTGTTIYSYNPITSSPALGAGRLAAVQSPMANSTITYGYDELGRVTSRDIGGTSESRVFDALGRLNTVTNPMGQFSYTYDGLTNRLKQVAYPNGQVAAFNYFDVTGSNRLQSIQNLKGDGTNISTFSYTYDPNGQIQSWRQQADAQAPKVYTFDYDAVGQLLKATLTDTGANQVLKTFIYGYDEAGNRTTESINGAITTSSFNALNQLTGQAFSALPSIAGPSKMPSLMAPQSGTSSSKAKATPSKGSPKKPLRGSSKNPRQGSTNPANPASR
jgi:YD repeat-containing protein